MKRRAKAEPAEVTVRKMVAIADALFRERARREESIQTEWAAFKRLLAGAKNLDRLDVRELRERIQALETEKAALQAMLDARA